MHQPVVAAHDARHGHRRGLRDQRELVGEQLGRLGDVRDHLTGQAGTAVQVPAVPPEDLAAEPDDRHRDAVDAHVDREHDGGLRVGQHHQ